MSIKDIQSWLNGEKLRSEKMKKQYPLLLLIAVLVFLYILAGYGAAEQQHRLTDLKKEMLDTKYEYMTISAELVKTTRQSQVAAELEQPGLHLCLRRRRPAVGIRDKWEYYGGGAVHRPAHRAHSGGGTDGRPGIAAAQRLE